MTLKKKKYIKKVIVADNLSTAEARAARLRRIRNMANLNRKEMCNEDLNINTYKGWEIGRYGGLPLDGAKKVIKRVADAGVICTADWLLHGKDSEPYIIPTYIKNSLEEQQTNVDQVIEHIHREIMFFQSHFSNTIYTKVYDDGLSPTFNPGDFVAGIRCFGKDIQSLIGKNCIIQTQDGDIITRCLKSSTTNNSFMLMCTNLQTSVNMPVLYDISIESAAPIIRLYRRDRRLKIDTH